MKVRDIRSYFGAPAPVKQSLGSPSKIKQTIQYSQSSTETGTKKELFIAKTEQEPVKATKAEEKNSNESEQEEETSSVEPEENNEKMTKTNHHSEPQVSSNSYLRRSPYFFFNGSTQVHIGDLIEEGYIKTKTFDKKTSTVQMEKQTLVNAFQKEEREIWTHFKKKGDREKTTITHITRQNGVQVYEQTWKLKK